MEKRAILAFALSAALLIVYQILFTPAPPPAPPEQEVSEAERRSGPAPEVPAPLAPAPTRVDPTAGFVRPPERTARVDSPIYQAIVSSEGGGLRQWTLKYRGEKVLAVPGELGWQGVILARGGEGGPVASVVSPEALLLDRQNPAGTLVMRGEDAYGVRVRQTLGFRADQYLVDVAVVLENARPVPQSVEVVLPIVAPAKPDEGAVQWPTEAVWTTGGTVHRQHDLANLGEQVFAGGWVGLGNVYYLTALVPRSPALRLSIRKAQGDEVQVALRQVVTLGPGQSWEGRAQLYAGPKEYERLRALGLEGAVDFGGFPVPRAYGGLPMEWLGVPVLWLMNRVYRYVGNYGIAIIILTVVTKVLFYPLTLKSVSSMKRMQAIQPQVNALRARFKSDPQRAQREMMELYRKEGVNPLGGCLPMIVQVPIFYALYIALSVSVELQNAPFICLGRVFGRDLWICDLATHDPIYVLPILMGATMFIQQKMMPVMGDPRQAKMMLFMPIVFTFMFLQLPSGLVLYWTVSNALQILQQYLMNRTPASATRREAKGPAHA
jgi:YidC/Oxa1 family membrane protein insertase